MHMASTETLGGFPRKMLSLEFLENDIRGNLNSCKMFADSVMQCQVDLKKLKMVVYVCEEGSEQFVND